MGHARSHYNEAAEVNRRVPDGSTCNIHIAKRVLKVVLTVHDTFLIKSILLKIC